MKTVDLTQLTSGFIGMRTLAGAWGNGYKVSYPSISVNWRKLLTGIAIWLALEICLSSLGIDDLADYGEFLFDRREIVLLQDLNFYLGPTAMKQHQNPADKTTQLCEQGVRLFLSAPCPRRIAGDHSAPFMWGNDCAIAIHLRMMVVRSPFICGR